MRLYKRKTISYFLALILTLAILVPALPARAETTKTVRVGYYENEVFEEGASPGAVKTGYAYEYYRKLSEYTGWNYEYVYGGFGELYDMLLNGDIDLLAGLAKKEDRIGLIGYPEDPMGNEIYSLVKHDDDTSVTWSPASVSGKRIGVLKSAVSEVLNDYLASHSITADVVTFEDYESLFDAFDSRDVDILAAEGDGAYGRDHAEVVCSFGASDYYLCVNIDRTDLLDELNIAQSQLATEEPGYLNTLRNKYYSSSVSGHTFSNAEREWMTEHKSLKIGYLNNYLPYSATDSAGQATGIVSEIMPELCEALSLSDISISYAGYDNYDDMIEAICNDQIDVAFPVGGGLYYSEENGIYQSEAVASTTTDLVYAGAYTEETEQHFAANKNNRMQYYYIRTNFPEAEITLYDNIDACLDAVLAGDVKATTLNGLRANDILKNRRYKDLYLKQLTKTDDRCFGVKIGNEGLLKLLNRGVIMLGPEYAQDVAYRYADQLYSYTILDMIKDNIGFFLLLLLIVAVIVIALIIRDLKRTRLSAKLKSDFVSNMSHEIRTPITAILGMNEMIQRESDDEKILSYSDNIERAGGSLLAIINDILDFSKIEAGHMEVSTGPYSLPELLSDLDLMIRLRAQEKNLQFSVEVDETLPVMPIGDVQKLRQVITNLLTNAVKYTEQGDVKLRLQLLSSTESDFSMEVSVSDTGIGIREEEMGKLYSAFDRLDLEKTRTIEGSGLGLTITHSLLELMDSEIHVESTYGKGSRFYFTLKQGISDATPIGPFEPSGVSGEGSKRKRRTATFTAPDARLLVVDDTPMNLQVICGLLKGNELAIDTAGSGKECLDFFKTNTYDLVFLDQRMPGMDGVETLHALRKYYPKKTEETPVISLTANAFSAAKEQMLKAGFTDYLPKPVNLADMETMLLKYLPKEKIRPVREKDPGAVQTSPEQAALIKALAEIPELDTESGISYCGDEEDYIDALNIFRNSAKERASLLEHLTKTADTEALTLLLHSLKSTSKAIGADSLSSRAAELEAKSKNGNSKEMKDDISAFTAEYIELSNKIDSTLDTKEG